MLYVAAAGSGYVAIGSDCRGDQSWVSGDGEHWDVSPMGTKSILFWQFSGLAASSTTAIASHLSPGLPGATITAVVFVAQLPAH